MASRNTALEHPVLKTEETTDTESQSSGGNSSLILVDCESVLVIGATGKTGTETVQQLAMAGGQAPVIFGMSRNSKEVAQNIMRVHRKHTEMLIEGDATAPSDLHRALLISNADTIILSIDDKKNPDVRTKAARALVQVLRHPPFRHIRLVVVSWAEAELPQQPQPQFCKSKKQSSRRHSAIIQDNAMQEVLLASDHTIFERTTFVHPKAFPSKKRVTLARKIRKNVFRDNSKDYRSFKATEDVTDLARCIVGEVLQDIPAAQASQ